MRNRLTALVATALIGIAVPAAAQETQPGDPCTAGQTDYIQQVGGPETSGVVHLLRCNGANWQQLVTWAADGNVGIGTASPQSALDVAGAIRIADGGEACGMSTEGAIRYNSADKCLDFCNGSAWTQVCGSCPASGLVAHWKLDESSGTTAADSAGSNDGTLTNGPTWQPAGGKLAGALEFDGGNDYVDSGYEPDWSPSDDFSLSLWFKSDVTSDTNDNSILAAMEGDEVILEIERDGSFCNNNELHFYFSDGTNGDRLCAPYGNDTNWHHVVVRYDFDGSVEMFIDGSSADSTAVTSTGTKGFTGNPLYIAAANNFGTNQEHMEGLIDDVRIYDRVLSPQDISDLYNGGAGCH